MSTTPDNQLPYPAGSAANNFAGAMQALALALDPSTVYHAGTFAARPNANTLPHNFYNVTDNTINGGLFLSDGTNWIRVTPSPWVNWNPNYIVTNGSDAPSTTTTMLISGAGFSGFLYRMLPGKTVEVDIEIFVSLGDNKPGDIPDFVGLAFTTPVPSARTTLLYGEYQNDLARCFTTDFHIGNSIIMYPHTGLNAASLSASYIGKWAMAATILRAHGTYPV